MGYEKADSLQNLIFCSEPGIHLPEYQLITISKRLCCLMMHEFISSKGRYHPSSGHMADNVALCNWAGVSQDKLCIVHQHFEHYLGV
jgi:hypothetical protein